MDEESTAKSPRWCPLEGDPEVFTKYVQSIGGPKGIINGEEGQDLLIFEELLSLEDWAFGMLRVPHPLAVILLYPLGPADDRKTLREQYETQIQNEKLTADLWFTEQKVHNACGTVAVLHLIGNLPRCQYPLETEGFLSKFMADCASLTGSERADLAEKSESLKTAHESHATGGQTAVPSGTDAEVDTHFVCLMPIENLVVEFDGRKPGPVVKGKMKKGETFLQASRQIIQDEFISKKGGDLRFSIMTVGDIRYAVDL